MIAKSDLKVKNFPRGMKIVTVEKNYFICLPPMP